ncbi:unnamed protein product [Urochloa decumbens]|uniref:Knottins-like domain-containing protein n=1 Tax=Urochloa decumbens TaxID=240449 RepID=A0ABC9GZ69_9POAL
MEFQLCKIAAAAALILMLLLTIGGQDLQASAGNDGSVCSAISHSKTFKGFCVSKPPCVAACRGEGYPDGYCFLDPATPDHRVCMCTRPCPPGTAAAVASRGNTTV